MAVLVTRPHPDDEATAAGLRARGFEVLLAPMLRFEPVAFHDDMDARYGAVIVTSANALRGIEPHLTSEATGCLSCRCSRWENTQPPPPAASALLT